MKNVSNNASPPALKILITNWHKHKDELAKIRRTVFIDEQNVPEDMEWDKYDETSTHFLATLDDKTVATARLKPDGQIGRMAVLSTFRSNGIGSELLRTILKNASSQKIINIYLHAQVTAIPFYERQGFIAHGEVFFEAGIPHREMWQKVSNTTHEPDNKYLCNPPRRLPNHRTILKII